MDSFFLATSEKTSTLLFNQRDFPATHFNYLTYDNHSTDASLEFHSPVRPYSKHTPQVPSFDTTSDVSLQIIPFTSNILVNTHNNGNPPPNLYLPPLPSLNDSITTQPSTSPSPHQINTPSYSLPPLVPL